VSSTLEGRVAIVTGGSKGIGAGIAVSLAAAGAAVVVNYAHDAGAAEVVVQKIAADGGRAVAVQADVSQADDVIRLFAETRSAFGPADILVNNAGTYTFAPLAGFSEADYHREFGLNVLGPFLTMQQFAQQPEVDGGAIINITSSAIGTPQPATALYTASKGAMTAATRVVAQELAGRKIRVNAIAAGPSVTEGTHALGVIGNAAEAAMVSQIPLGRLGLPEDVGPVAVFLASEDARWITGDVLFASGGQS
jgi:3-oxoacyl-[acyl-carrier protein] reductase